MDKTKGKLLMLFTCMMWGANFTFSKLAVEGGFTTFYFMGIRFFIGSVFLALIFKDHLKKIDKKLIIDGLFLGLFMFSANTLVIFSLRFIKAMESTIFLGLQIPIIPIFAYFIIGEKLCVKKISAILLAFIGVIIMNYTGSGISFSFGAYISILAAALFSLHIIYTGKFVKEEDAIALVLIQSFFIGVVSLGLAIFTEPVPINLTTDAIYGLLFSVFFVNIMSYLTQALAQENIDDEDAGLIISTIPMFGMLISFIILGDVLTFNGMIGSLIILFSIIMGNIHIEFKASHLIKHH